MSTTTSQTWFDKLVESLGSFEAALNHCFSTSFIDVVAARNFKALQRLANYLKNHNQTPALRQVNFTLQQYGLNTSKVLSEATLENALEARLQSAQELGFNLDKYEGRPIHILRALALRFLAEKQNVSLLLTPQKKTAQKRTAEERILSQAKTLLKTLEKEEIGYTSQLESYLVKLITRLEKTDDTSLNEVYNETL